MAIQIGIVKALIGTVTATSADGSTRNLQVGDSVYANELVSTGTGAAVELEFADGSVMDLGRDSQALLDNTVFNLDALAETAAVAEADADAIQAAILAGADPTQVTEATAAGAGTQADGNEGHAPVVIDYLAPQVTPTSGFDTTGISVAFPEIVEELQAPVEEPLAPQEPQPEIIIDVTLSRAIDQESGGVYENETITYIATLNQTSQGNISVTLSNGAVIIISAGSLTGSVTVPAQGEDVYVDGELLTVSITGVTGGAGEGLTFNSTPVDVQIFDTIDDTTLTLNDATVDEGTGTATMGATLSAAPTDGDVVFTLSNGATITFTTAYVAGTTVQSTAFAIQGDDVYVDGESFEVSAVSYTGGAEFENLVHTDKATVTVNDTIDDTTLTLNDVAVDEGTGTATIGATLSAVPTDGDLVFTLSNGATVTFTTAYVAGTTVQSTAFAIQGDDVYVDGESYDVSAVSYTGGAEFEDLVHTDKATVTIDDTIDDTTLTLNDVAVDEGTSTATIGATLSAVPNDGDLVFTLSNGATVTFTTAYVAGTIIQSTAFAIQGDDVYVDGESYDVSAVSYTGGAEFENLVHTDKATVTVDDTINPTTVTLDDINVTEAGAITYKASVNNGPQGAFTVILNNGVVINFADGALTGSSAPQVAQGDDVYNDGTSYGISITSTSGGNYEAVNTDSTATVTITDTIDTVTATLTTDVSEISENGGAITYTVTLTGTPGAIDPDNDLVFTLTNPDGSGTAITVTVSAGATSGQTIVNYSDGQITNQASFDNSIASYTGGSEYEHLQTAGSTSVDVDYAPVISGLTSKLDGGDVTVDEDDLLDGSDTSKESTTQIGTFTVTAEDGISSLTVGGHAIITAGVFAATSFVTAFGNTLSFTEFNSLTGVVTYSYTLEDNETHANAAGENSLFEDFTVVLLDTDLDETSAVLSVNIIDDVPTSLNPTTSHLKDVATSPDVVQLLNFAAGADGVGGVVFDKALEGQVATDALGNELTFNGTGDPLFIHFSADGTQLQFVTQNSDGTLNTTDAPKFFIQLSADGQTYSVHSAGIINNGTAVSSATIETVGGGNTAWKAFINLGGTDQDAFLTTNSGNSVNTNNGEIGISGGNSFTAGEGLRIDLLNGVTTSGSGGSETYAIAGPHNLTNSFRQIVSFVNNGGGGTGANITVSAIIANDYQATGNTASNLFFNDADDALINLSLANITVYNGSGAIVTMPVGSLIDNGTSITIKGLQAGWTFEITSDTEFNAVKIEAATGTSTFKLGVFSYGEDSDGLPIELDYNIIGTDSDGDSVTGSLGVNLYPNGSTIEGTDDANTLNGTNNADYLLGRGGDDFLFGNGGDDLLIGGYGDDQMTGGLGKDSFVFSLAANSGDDIIKDFEVGIDKLNFIDVLDLNSSGDFDLNDAINSVSDSGIAGNITVSLTNGGSVILEGIGNGSINDAVALQNLLGATNITVDQS